MMSSELGRLHFVLPRTCVFLLSMRYHDRVPPKPLVPLARKNPAKSHLGCFQGSFSVTLHSEQELHHERRSSQVFIQIPSHYKSPMISISRSGPAFLNLYDNGLFFLHQGPPQFSN